MLNSQDNVYIIHVLDKLYIFNEIKENNIKIILNVHADLTNNILYRYFFNNN